jgi:hypothetical protein
VAESSPELAPLEEAVRRLDAALAHVPEREMRAQLVLEALEARDPACAYALCAAILGRPVRAGSTFDVLRDTLHDLLLQPAGTEHQQLDYEHRSAIYAEASAAADEEVMRALRTFAPSREVPSGQRTVPRKLADIPLGRRRSLARAPDVALLEQLARDPDPIVITNLLANPRLREEDVLRMAALRPVAETTLIEIHRSPRWAPRPRVRIALARNPYCPVDIAVKVLASIPKRDLRDIRQDTRLHAEVRGQAEAELARRRGEVVEEGQAAIPEERKRSERADARSRSAQRGEAARSAGGRALPDRDPLGPTSPEHREGADECEGDRLDAQSEGVVGADAGHDEQRESSGRGERAPD